jgi:hypothetical protein
MQQSRNDNANQTAEQKRKAPHNLCDTGRDSGNMANANTHGSGTGTDSLYMRRRSALGDRKSVV